MGYLYSKDTSIQGTPKNVRIIFVFVTSILLAHGAKERGRVGEDPGNEVDSLVRSRSIVI